MKKINNLKTTRRIKIVLTLFISYVLVSTITPQVFVANSYEVKDSFLVWMKLTPQRVYAYIRYPLNKEERTNTIENAELTNTTVKVKEDLTFSSISEGVYAAEDTGSDKKFIKIEKGTKVEVNYIKLSDGREVKVYVPIK